MSRFSSGDGRDSGSHEETRDLEGSSSIAAKDLERSSMAVKVYIVYYSMNDHVETIAKEILNGVNSVEGVEGKLWKVPETRYQKNPKKVPETLPDEELDSLGAARNCCVPIITPTDFIEADGFIFGFPARLGTMASQFKGFLETTESSGKKGHLAGKPASFFYNSDTPGIGQETSALTAVTLLAHHGMVFVPIGCALTAEVEVNGGSPYGTAAYTGDGFKQSAFHQGKRTAKIAKQLKESGIHKKLLENDW